MNTRLVVLLSMLAATTAAARPRSPQPPDPQTVPSVKNDDSPALRDLAPVPPRPDGERRPELRRHLPPGHAGHGAGGGRRLLPDPVVQGVPGVLAMPSAAESFDGLPNVDLVLPPDTNGAVGPNHYVQWVNTSFAIFDKAGTLLYGPAEGNTLWTGFGGPCESDNEGDPIVLHDHLADRWFMSQLALPGFPFGPFYQCIAVSASPDPTGPYHRYAFVVSDTKLNDYPKFGVWPDAYYLAVNQFDAISSAFLGQGVLAFERDRMLAGLPASMVYLDLFAVDPDLGGMLPADMDGPPPPPGSPGYFVQLDDDAAGSVAQDQLQLWRFHVDWNDPSASTFTGPAILATAPFDSNMCGYARSCIPQPGTRRGLDAISDRLMYRLQYRNLGTHESLVVNHTVDVGGDHAGIRWYEIRDPGGAPFIQQQSTYAPDADHRWMGSAAMDGAGNLAIGFSVASGSTFPSVRYAGRLAGDPPGILTQGEATLVAGSGSQTDTSGRWGDYSSMSVDPTDHCTFWYTQEYYAATSAIGWRTRIGSFRFPSCAIDLPFVSVEATDAAGEAGLDPGAFTVRRTGSTADTLVVLYAVRGTATAGSDYVALAGSVTIPAGAASATIDVLPIDDALIEEDETVVVTLSAAPAYMAGTPSSSSVTIVNDDLPPDLVVTALSAPATGGAGATITVTDTTRNQGGGAAGPSTTRLYLSTNATLDAGDVALGGRAVPALAPGTASTGAIAVVIPAGTAAGPRWVIARADADDALGESQEGNNTTAVRQIQIGPDLIVSALTVPATAGAGLTTAVSDTVKNQGGGGAGVSAVRFYLSTNTVLDGGDTLLGTRALPALAPAATSAGSTSLTIPPGTAPGTYYVIARVDPDNAVAETQESNNTTSRTTLVGPDLIVAGLSVPGMAGAGTAITVSDTVKNQGGEPAGTSTTAFYLSTDATLGASDLALGSRAVPVLAPGAVGTGSTALTIPPGTAVGSYFIIARVDAGDAVAETRENNNTAAGGIKVGGDLVIGALTVPATAGAGTTIAVTDTTRNQGADPVAASTTAFFLSADAVLDGADVTLGSRPVPALGPGTTSTASTLLAIPADTTTGSYFVIARADAADAVGETLEGNNTSARSIKIGPDLIVVSLSVPGTAAAGAAVVVGDTVKNQGGGPAGASTTSLYLSTNTTLDGADLPLGNRAVPALAPGATSSDSTTVTIPSGTTAGSYYVVARADAANGVAETAEGNNTTAGLVRVGPDLVIAVLTVPAAADAGATVTVGDTARNQGAGTAGASTTVFYLSTNTTVDAGDAPLGARAVPPLTAGASGAGSTTMTIPTATPAGTYYIVSRADADDAVAESLENNNTTARSIQIGPDLIIVALSTPSTATAGATITVSDTTKNNGGGPAAASATAVYLSTNTTLDAGDVLLGSRPVPGLSAGATSPGSNAVGIPAGTAPGGYFLLVRADADGVVAESQESNNTSSRAIQIGAGS